MKKVLLIPVLGLLLGGSIPAGTLSPELAQTVASRSADQLVTIWIVPAHSSRGREAAAVAERRAATRADRYKLVADDLRTRAELGQSGIVGRLRELEKSQRSTRIKGHWVSNIVEARVAVGELAALAKRPDIAMIYEEPAIELIRPQADATATSPTGADTTYTNIKYINANQAWAMGYTGAGRVVCIFDTGVDGAHRALRPRWKGLNGDSSAAWFDPVTHTTYPQVVAGGFPQHGTHVAGIVLGADPVTNDTIGVAPAAKWIATAIIDRLGASILDAFDWAADPDGDPNTVDDVPDVINHSWGYSKLGCADLFFDAIDNTEALGILNIFSAGNEGPGISTIRVPASRDNDSLDCFAAGASDIFTNPPNATIWGQSSRGPSTCNGHFKPNVVAPGYFIKSCYPNNTYYVLSGTSMAAPHVSGLALLLRQKNPNATVTEIKTAILTSTRKTNSGVTPNNTWGWGEIDCVAALNALPANSTPVKLRVWDFVHAPVNPGGTFDGPVIVQNRGVVTATGVAGMITSADPRLTIVNGSVSFGNVNASDTARSSSSIKVSVSPDVVSGTMLSLDFLLSANGGVTVPAKLYFQVGPPSSKGLATHVNGKVKFSLTNYGLYGGGPQALFPFGGVGFQVLPSSADFLYEGGLMVGTGLSQVSSAVHSFIDKPDQDFAVIPGGDMVYTAPGALAAQETHCRFNDATASAPIGVEITQDSYVQNAPNDDFVTIRFIVKNATAAPISGLRIGLYLDWDCISYLSNAGGFEASDSVLWVAYDNGSTQSGFRGMKLVQGPLTTAMTGKAEDITTLPYFNGNGYLTYEKWQSLANGFVTSDSLKTQQNDLFQVMAAGPLALGPGGSDTVAFAIMGADNLPAMQAIAKKATLYRPWSCCHGTAGNIDCDPDGIVDISDVSRLIDNLFISLLPLCCPDAAQLDNDEPIDIGDLTMLIDALFISITSPQSCP
jgi:subtilisin family serine protease